MDAVTAPADGPTALPKRPAADPNPPIPPQPTPVPDEAPTQAFAAGSTPPSGQPSPAPEFHNPIATSSDHCPSCGATLAADQRYCLNCGQRRGDPRLPFMDAVAFMESSKGQPPAQQAAAAPPSTPDRRPFMSANASLVAGVATLVLAIGVGVLIGRSGDSGSNTANQAPQVITVGGSGAPEAEPGTGKEGKGNAGKGASKSGKPKSASQKKAAKKLETSSHGATKATEEAYPTAPGVTLAEPEQKVGGKCDPKAEGCNSSGEFDGSFFE